MGKSYKRNKSNEMMKNIKRINNTSKMWQHIYLSIKSIIWWFFSQSFISKVIHKIPIVRVLTWTSKYQKAGDFF
jgi:hypothetical protein